MHTVVDRIDDLGKPAWIALMVLAFILFFPLGLALLAYLIWSGRMGCRHQSQHAYAYGPAGDAGWNEGRKAHIERKISYLQEKLARWSQNGQRPRTGGFAPTGNAAFDEYRDATLQRLEDEAAEFQDFLKRLRAARDKEEFDAYMAKRRGENANPAQPDQPQG